MPDHTEHYTFRSELEERLRRDVLGPVGAEDEEITDPPVTAYPAGVLFPRQTAPDRRTEEAAARENEVPHEVAGADDPPETGVALANMKAPSAMGISFAVDPSASAEVVIAISAAVYVSVDAYGHEVTAGRAEWRTTSEDRVRWRRRPLHIDRVPLDLSQRLRMVSVAPGLELRVLARPPKGTPESVSVTVTLVNVHEVGPAELQDPYCFFQTRIEVEGVDGSTALVERRVPTGADDREVQLNALLYRHAPTFAIGHGCSAEWEHDAPRPGDPRLLTATPEAVSRVWTSHVPATDVLLMDSNQSIGDSELGMERLAHASSEQVVETLRALIRGYREWISARDEEARLLEGHASHGEAAREQVELCREACDRMAAGVETLRDEPDAMGAFQRANEAMAVQRARAQWIRDGRTGALALGGQRWRPFQIGFILLSLNGIVDEDHEDRGIADLLWFPTGGGKTEAYLGLIAFTTFLRRKRRGPEGGGVTAIMRYTLRLLTLQQFQRAASLICAMERIRSSSPGDLGEESISLGMWVGGAGTPNTLKDAAASLKVLKAGGELQQKDPVQLRACPWCGTPLGASDYQVDADPDRMRILCPDSGCEFHVGLPVHLVDQELYRVRPTLVIATVDKYAQIAWRPQVAALFNRDRDDDVRPPELIVQDELHLISGPLGSLMGLYETAIDAATGRAKVVASTATIRRAKEQGNGLFDREVRQFPPQGLDARDSWFSVETSAETKASRRYLGLLTPNTSQASLLVRAYAALLHHAATIDGDTGVRDAYWTLVGYFNSLRLLASAELQVLDDVQDRLARLAGRDGRDKRDVGIPAELTSRVKASDIPKRLQDLDVAHPDAGAFDTVLATNMISVGVDIDRLGLMAIMGQPQTTAEYIQSSSRVGRRHPGLAIVLFNSARSRDRSHYEAFTSYHSALYRGVESSSVTPFSARARDRGLHAVLVGMVRLLHPELRMNAGAAQVTKHETDVRAAMGEIVERVRRIDLDEADDTEEDLERFLDDWLEMADENPDLVYEAPRRHGGARRERGTALLRSHTDEDLEDAFTTLWSLRDVDAESDLYPER